MQCLWSRGLEGAPAVFRPQRVQEPPASGVFPPQPWQEPPEVVLAPLRGEPLAASSQPQEALLRLQLWLSPAVGCRAQGSGIVN